MRFIVGIDEVGRGCLAGPVTVAAVAIPMNYRPRTSNLELRDSKKLTAKQREEWFEWIRERSKSPVQSSKLYYVRANVYPKTIDRINISQAANLAATRALKKLLANSQLGLANRVKIFLDGGLYLNSKSLMASGYILNPRTIVRGDEKYNCVKLASIVAKVGRDRIMKRHHRTFPVYRFDQHVGYGTRVHIRAIKKHGPCELHRLTFIKNFV
jgi:ribonuclease HII